MTGKPATAPARVSKARSARPSRSPAAVAPATTGVDKVHLEHAFAATAVNLIRLDVWWTGIPLQRTRTTHLARVGLTLAA
jgi:hypothetical protein